MNEQDFSQNNMPQNAAISGNDTSGFAPYQEEPRVLKHSGPGIASFVISIVTLAGYIVSFIVAGTLIAPVLNETDVLKGESGGAFLFLGLAILALAALNVIGVVVGIIGLALRGRRKVFGIIGTIINGLILLLFLLLFAVVLMSAGSL
ncbi:hypothetical protein SAMN04487895_105218 [Paenibacillus sophorae]|uniref:Uncharacterized protein n=1 Tax=Paenibacillus sophorae TaxID=1333845 RepID=A0A1H8MGF0_9BACL|nr:hypothetical protein [Paenibacillus sophorae]QWU17800.1 hypothetical protein KP014_12065 [Paenibacillus sophorae]SEO16298.1 hypothetical protein SAMN04487895_105218 [Paenibacillus sophorae]